MPVKLVATRHFANVPSLGFTDFKTGAGQPLKTPHAFHVPKGARFEVGGTAQNTTADLNKNDQLKIVQLLPGGGANCAILDNDGNKAAIAKVDQEVKDETAKAKEAAEPVVSLADVIESNRQVTEAIGGLAAALAKK